MGKLPAQIQQAAEQAAEAYATGNHSVSFADTREKAAHLAGWAACYAHLQALAPEFDSGAVVRANGDIVKDHNSLIVGARWQHAQSAAQLAALRAENARVEKQNGQWREAARLEAQKALDAYEELDRLHAEVERLKSSLSDFKYAQKETIKERDQYLLALEQIVSEGIDTSTDGGMNFVREALKGNK